MLYSGTDPESYITDYTLVYEDKTHLCSNCHWPKKKETYVSPGEILQRRPVGLSSQPRQPRLGSLIKTALGGGSAGPDPPLGYAPCCAVCAVQCTGRCPLSAAPCSLHPAPYTLHPTPYTLHPSPWRDWCFIAEQPAPALHLVHPGGCAALRIVLVTVPRVSRSCEPFPDGFDLQLLQPLHPTPHTLNPTPYTLHPNRIKRTFRVSYRNGDVAAFSAGS